MPDICWVDVVEYIHFHLSIQSPKDAEFVQEVFHRSESLEKLKIDWIHMFVSPLYIPGVD
jgi:hypothetical protein